MDEINTSRFFAYSNYLIAASRLMRQCHPTDSSFAANLCSMSGVTKIKKRDCDSIPRIAELLRNSWFTEVALCEARKYPDFLPFSNPWAMVQAYYSIYLTIRAYFHAFNRVVAPTHRTTLRTISSDLVSCKNRFPEPWKSILIGDTKSKPIHFANSHYSKPLKLSNALESPYTADPWQHYFLFLKTTRDRQIKSAIDKWKIDQSKKRINSTDRSILVSNIHQTSFFDALYRIRARSNYRDVDSFAFGSSTPVAADELHEALASVIYCTLFMFEIMIYKSIGKWHFSRIVNAFLRSATGSRAGATIGSRWSYIRVIT